MPSVHCIGKFYVADINCSALTWKVLRQAGPSIAPGEESKPAPAESSGQAGKPELPQQEPAVAPGTTITIPESKNIAPEPKVEAPKPATKVPAAPVPKPAEDENPFAVSSQCEHLSLLPDFLPSCRLWHTKVEVHPHLSSLAGGEGRGTNVIPAICVCGIT